MIISIDLLTLMELSQEAQCKHIANPLRQSELFHHHILWHWSRAQTPPSSSPPQPRLPFLLCAACPLGRSVQSRPFPRNASGMLSASEWNAWIAALSCLRTRDSGMRPRQAPSPTMQQEDKHTQTHTLVERQRRLDEVAMRRQSFGLSRGNVQMICFPVRQIYR